MKKTLFKIIKYLLPNFFIKRIKDLLGSLKHQYFLSKLKKDILKYYSNRTKDKETAEIIKYLEKKTISVFPYEFTKKYSKDIVQVFSDEKTGLKYVMHQRKRLFFKRSLSENAIKSLYVGLQIDQDPDSPHLYLTKEFNLDSMDVIADIGAAEGNFSLSNVEKVKKIYLFESNQEWVEALRATFKPWENKVIIVNKFVTNHDSDQTVNINTFYSINSDITFFKVDIEGEEKKFLSSCSLLFDQLKNVKIAICTYHKHYDEQDFKKYFLDLGFEIEHSKGYMIYIYDNLIKAPFLRRGLLRAEKK